MVALTLGKYGMDVDFTGAVGEDEQAKKMREIFDKYQVKTQYLETCYTEKSAVSYKIYNSKSNKFTSINETANKLRLSKYKYEFIPDVVIMDDKDYNANLAAINNYPNALLIYIGDKFTKESSIYCNKCKYIITNLSFASGATGITDGLNKSKNIVALFQKFIDLYEANLIIKLDNFDLLYCVDNEVRMIKNINKSITNKDSVYYSVLIYFIINNYDIENAIKLTNKVMLSSANEIDFTLDIPDYSFIESAIKEYNENKSTNNYQNIENQNIQNVEEVKNNNVVPNVQEQMTPITENNNVQQPINQNNIPIQNIQNQNINQPQNTVIETNQNINNNGVNNG